MALITMKFGGTSMGSADAISQAAAIISKQRAEGDQVLAVVSAMNGMTDGLLRVACSAASGDRSAHLATIAEMRARHHTAASALVSDPAALTGLLASLDALFDDLIALCHSLAVLREATPRALDQVASFGERLSARLLAARLCAIGVTARAIDATDLIVTDDNFQDAAPQMDETRVKVQAILAPMLREGQTPVVTGFIGATRSGITTTLGRGGSDFSGAILGAAADTNELWIYTDVDGVMTTDPRLAPDARVLDTLSYAEVGELAYFGAKVLHPKTVQPIVDRGVPMRVRNTFNPTHPGTLIQPELEIIPGVVKAVTIVKDVHLLSVEGRGMMGVPGIAGRTFMAVARANASILMISQASSEQSFCFVLPSSRAEAALTTIKAELAAEIARHNVDRVYAQTDVVIVTVVGAGIRNQPGVAARVFGALADRAINVLVIAQGSSECSISLVVSESDAAATVNALHTLVMATA
jgi:aspartate kinase